MSDTPNFVERRFPSRIANLGFRLRLPEHWQPQELPPDEPAFDEPASLFAIGAAAAPYAPIVLAAAARPAYDEGTVLDWSRWLIEQNKVDLRALGPSRLGELPAIVGQCVADSDLGPMTTHFAFAEDGARLIHLSLTGPEAFATHVWQVWREAIASFRLDSPQGATVPLSPAATVHRPASGSAAQVASMGSFALEGGAATLEQDHPINRRLLEQGQGFAPNLRQLDEAAGVARVSSMALQAVLAVPLGWHVLDDSQRLLLLHPDSSVQLSLQRLSAPGADLDALLAGIEAQVRTDYPAPNCIRVASGPLAGLAVRDIADGDQALHQFHLLMAGEQPDTALRARATAVPEQADKAAELAAALLYGVQFSLEMALPDAGADAGAVDGGQPGWARRARALEAENQLDEAEAAIRQGGDSPEVRLHLASMYRQRMARLGAAGDPAGAAEAHERALRWIRACHQAA